MEEKSNSILIIECKYSIFEDQTLYFMRVAIVGITGLVGELLLKLLEERKFPVTEFFAVASNTSVGKKISFRETEHQIIGLEELLKEKLDIAFFSAGNEVSKIWGPRLAEKGCKVIDNSAYFRMFSKHKLIIPEINSSVIEKKDMIISNPNCSTIQMLMAIAPLHRRYIVKRIVISTYQAVSGTGIKGVNQMNNESLGNSGEKIYPHPIFQNVIPHCDSFEKNGYTKEELKLTNETKKILSEKIEVTATAVRVPVNIGHSESINICFGKEFKLKEIREILQKKEGVSVQDNPKKNIYPTPVLSKGKDNIFVGRIRRDFTQEKTLNMWVVSDNLRKGAATNAIQIAEHLIKKKWI